jgi:hypothetical protein
MLILDYSQVCLSNIFAFSSDINRALKNDDKEQAISIIRTSVLASIKLYKKKYGYEYGKMVIACDGRNYWRKEVFSYYKASRAKAREKSDLDWKFIFETLSLIREDLEKYFPYKIINVERCEADDVIAVLTKWVQTNELISEGLYEDAQKVMIISSDKDFKQLHKYNGVRQWSPMQKKFVEGGKLGEYLIEHIVRGDSGDGVPNVYSKDDVFMNPGERQTPVTAKKLARFMELGFDACENDEQRRNWQRNQSLVDFEFIPEDISSAIIDRYVNTKILGDKMSIMNYLIKNKCRLLLDELEEF